MESQKENSVVETKKKNPVFLRIICVFSFVGIAIVVFSSLMNIFYPSDTKNMIGQMGAMANSKLVSMDYDKYVFYSEISNYFNLIAAIVCLIGVVFMWRLKRAGYFLYVLGEIAPPVFVFVLFSDFFGNPLESIKYMIPVVLLSVVAFVFIILYSLNLKFLS